MRYGWPVIVLSFVTMMLGSGATFTFGLIVKPVAQEMVWSRASISLAMSVFLLAYGFSQPLIGRLIDRIGPKRTIALFMLVMASGALLIGSSSMLVHFYVFFGLLVGLGYSGTAVLPISVLISRWFVKGRGFVMGVVFTGYSVGQLFLMPLSQLVLSSYGWRFSYLPLGLAMVLFSFLILTFVKDRPRTDASKHLNNTAMSPEEGVRFGTAVRTKTFWFVTLAYLACGFTDFLVSTHIAPFASDMGFGPDSGAYALSLIGGANVLGLLVAGRAADRIGSNIVLVFVYLVRWAALVLLQFVSSVEMLYLFSLVFGTTFFTSAALTSNFIRERFGGRWMGSIFGLTALIHHISGASGSFFGGLVYDLTGGYALAFLVGSFLVLMAAILCFLTRIQARNKVAEPVTNLRTPQP